MSLTLRIVLRCQDRYVARVRYLFDSLLLARGIDAEYATESPISGPWIEYVEIGGAFAARSGCLTIAHDPAAWSFFDAPSGSSPETASTVDGHPAVLPSTVQAGSQTGLIAFDIVANAFYFLSSWDERAKSGPARYRHMYVDSAFARLGVPQDVVDRYLCHILDRLETCFGGDTTPTRSTFQWPGAAKYALALTHDVDFLPSRPADIAIQGSKSIARHLVRQLSPMQATIAALNFLKCAASGRDPYGCLPYLPAQERTLGVNASYQIAVARRHPLDVNYDVNCDRTREKFREILDLGAEICLHGSYLSTTRKDWYVDEVRLLSERVMRPIGSRQHYLSFDYDNLFSAQEEAGVAYDMSMGYPDRIGPRSGASFPYFPYDLKNDRPYKVLQLGLGLMDVTLQSYMGLRARDAWTKIEQALTSLAEVGGCTSCVWHPIVFGGARDPGYDQLYWKMVEHARESGGYPTDGRTINQEWRRAAARYTSFAWAA